MVNSRPGILILGHVIHVTACSPALLCCFTHPYHLFLYSLKSLICAPLPFFSDGAFLCRYHMLLAWVSFTPCVFCPCVHHSFLRTSVAFLLLLETFRFLHFPLLVHPSAQERLGVFPVFWLLFLACSCCLYQCWFPRLLLL